MTAIRILDRIVELVDVLFSFSGNGRKGLRINDTEDGVIAIDELSYFDGSNTRALLEIDQTKVPITDRCGATRFITRKTTGSQALSANWFSYLIEDSTAAHGGFETAATSLTVMTHNSGAAVPMAHWFFCVGPTTADNPFAGQTTEFNYQERIADRGLYTDRAAAPYFTSIITIAAESMAWAGTGYNISSGIAFGPSAFAPYPGMYIPIFMQEKCIAPGGIGILMQGGTSSADDPRSAVEFTGHYGQGLDFTGATINNTDKPIISLADLQRIFLGTTRVWADGNDLKFSDATIGTRTLAQLSKPPVYTIATLPAASTMDGYIVYVSDGSAGQKFRGSDGSSWLNIA